MEGSLSLKTLVLKTLALRLFWNHNKRRLDKSYPRYDGGVRFGPAPSKFKSWHSR